MVNVNQNQLGSVTTIINYLAGYILQKYNRNMNDTGVILAVYVNLLINYIVLNPTILPSNFNVRDISSMYQTPLKNLIIWAKHLDLGSDEKRIAFKNKFTDEINAEIRNRWRVTNEITPEIQTFLDENAVKDLLEIIIKFHDRIAPNWPNINYRINFIQNRIDNIPNSEDIKLANKGWDFLVEMTLASRRQDENRSSRLGGKKSRKFRKSRKNKKSRKYKKSRK